MGSQTTNKDWQTCEALGCLGGELISVWSESLKVIWLALPVVAAAVVLTLTNKFDLAPWLKKPLDCGATFRGKRVFGDNKTLRGALIYGIVSALAVIPQGIWRVPSLELFDYSQTYLPYAMDVGLLLGLGWVLGELPNSFLKRQQGVGPGESGRWWNAVLDQVDSLVGALLCLSPVFVAPWQVWALVLVICTGLHVAFNVLFVMIGIKENVF